MKCPNYGLDARRAIRFRRQLMGLALASSAGSAGACGACTLGLMWDAVPPSLWWAGIGVFWYVYLLVVRVAARVELVGIPTPVVGIVLLVGSVIVGMFPLGALVFPVYGTLALLATISYLAGPDRSSLKTKLIGGGAGVAVMLALVSGVFEYSRASRMDEVDRILAWSGLAISRKWQKSLREQEPASADQYRRLIDELPDSIEAADSAVRLSGLTSSTADILRVVDAAVKVKVLPFVIEDYRKAVEAMTSTSLGDSSPSEWRARLR